MSIAFFLSLSNCTFSHLKSVRGFSISQIFFSVLGTNFCYKQTINRMPTFCFSQHGGLLLVFSITAILQPNKCVLPPNFISFLIISKSPSVLHHPPNCPCCQWWVGKNRRATNSEISFACNPTAFALESSEGKTQQMHQILIHVAISFVCLKSQNDKLCVNGSSGHHYSWLGMQAVWMQLLRHLISDAEARY